MRTPLAPADAGVRVRDAAASARCGPQCSFASSRVEGEGSAGEFELNVAIAHPASGEVALTLAAPSGAQATMLLPQSNAASSESYVFAAQEGTPLAALADEERRGTWRLTLVDRRVENTGTLGGWGLRFGEEGWRDDPPDGVAMPDPQRTEAVTVEMSADDAFAIVQPAERGADRQCRALESRDGAAARTTSRCRSRRSTSRSTRARRVCSRRRRIS